MLPTWAIWLILCGVFLLAEIFTVSFLLFWPGIGAFLAFCTEILGFSFPVQIAVFVISTILMIIFMKPLVKKFFKTKDTPMNNETIIGKNAIVSKKINTLQSKGQVKINGELWSAVSTDGNPIEDGETVVIEKVDGVKLIVKKVL
ncbi:MAG: NfeD family protein [Clostridia bacterium]